MALFEAKLAAAMVLQKFKLSLCPGLRVLA
jgi:hypothetical protein